MRAIETNHNGALMRSRLEARWGAFFDLCGWRWAYEPIDLNGYIPDFCIYGKEPIIVEVKPALKLNELNAYTPKIEQSGWEGDALIVGAGPMPDGMWGHPLIGLLSHRHNDNPDDWFWGHSQFTKCPDCGLKTFFHESGLWACAMCGGGHKGLWYECEWQCANLLWNEAGTATRWIPSA